jgi:hypothetical protein
VSGVAVIAAGTVLLLFPPSTVAPDVGALPSPAATPGAGAIPPVSGAQPRAGGNAGSAPVQLRLPGVTAAVRPAPVDRSGTLAVPRDSANVGWWIGGSTAGSARGTVVLAGHVDTEGQRGALYGLEQLAMGTIVTVDTANGRYAYKVVARRSFRKERLPDALFALNSPPRLALVTCGGQFEDGSYDHNVVVYAVPTRA